MKKIKVIVFAVLLMAVAFLGFKVYAEGEEEEVTTTSSERTPVSVIVFHGETCPHCQELFEWFDSIEEEYGQYYDLDKYEVWNDEENSELMSKVADYLGEDAEGVPYVIIGTKTFNGFAQSMSQEIIDAIMTEYNKNVEERINVVANVLGNVPLKEKSDNTATIIFIVAVVAVVAFVIFARNGQDTAEINADGQEDEVEEVKEVKEEKHEEKREEKKVTSTKSSSKKSGKKKSSKK